MFPKFELAYSSSFILSVLILNFVIYTGFGILPPPYQEKPPLESNGRTSVDSPRVAPTHDHLTPGGATAGQSNNYENFSYSDYSK